MASDDTQDRDDPHGSATQRADGAARVGDAQEMDARFTRESGLAARIAEIVAEPIADLGYRIVRVRLIGTDGQTLQIMAERPDGTMTIEDCETISRQISPVLDTYDPMVGSYRLEISSPGIDRPLVRPSDFEAWAGYEARVELAEALDGRKRFRGTLEGYADGEMRLEVDLPEIGRQVIGIPVGLIGEAKLVLTDDLVRESLRRTKAGGGSDGRQGVGDGSEAPDDIDFQSGDDPEGDVHSGDNGQLDDDGADEPPTRKPTRH